MPFMMNLTRIIRPSFSSKKYLLITATPFRNYASNIPIDWKRPTKVEWYDIKKTGDGVGKLDLNMDNTPLELENNKELATASKEVQKLFTFHFLGRKFAKKRAIQEMINLVKNHKYDSTSLEVNIAAKTAVIRGLLEEFHTRKLPRNLRIYLKELIERRNSKLKDLRRFDYKKFEWLLDKLDLYFKPLPEVLDKVERKKSIRRLTERYVEDYKNRKLEEYREFLKSQKANYYRERIIALEWIQMEEKECGVAPTVSDKDIEETKQKLDTFLKASEKVEKKKVSTNILLNY